MTTPSPNEAPPPLIVCCVAACFVRVSHLAVLPLLVIFVALCFNTALINWFPVITFGTYIFEKLYSKTTPEIRVFRWAGKHSLSQMRLRSFSFALVQYVFFLASVGKENNVGIRR